MLCTGDKPLRVGVFDTEDEITAFVACKKIIVKSCTDSADVQRTCGTGGETNPYAPVFCHCQMVFIKKTARKQFHLYSIGESNSYLEIENLLS